MEKIEHKVLMVARSQVGKLFPGLSPKTLANMLSEGRGPACFRRGRLIFYKVADLEAWLTQSPVMTEGGK